MIQYSLPHEGRTRLTVFDGRGRRIAGLVNALHGPGEQSIRWDGRDDERMPVPSGVYFVRLEFEGEGSTRRLVLLK